ncbi:MAG: N-acetylglutaminylglutamine synthetase [Proteobacteria bacterium]|nr:N-acetylglutaminylglutamine synthetase [Pseudomonadota bacterium]
MRLKNTRNLIRSPTLRNWRPLPKAEFSQIKPDATVDMGWGRIIFGHTFQTNQTLLSTILEEENQKRDIAIYIRDVHVLLSMRPDNIFLDPSHTYRLWQHDYKQVNRPSTGGYTIRRINSLKDANEINRIYAQRHMMQCAPEFLLDEKATKLKTYLTCETQYEGRITGTVTGIDHVEAFNDPENGASLWCLAVDAQGELPGMGEALVRHLVEHYFTKSRSYVDLSVMHDNDEAMKLYEKLGFQRIPVYAIKRKNPINEPLFVTQLPEDNMNPYAGIIIEEARKRGISIDIIDEENGYFKLDHGGRSIICRESLSELTSAVAMSRCDDKRITNSVLKKGELSVPRQLMASDTDFNVNLEALERLGRVVVKPARGEQGNGISVDIKKEKDLKHAISLAKHFCNDVIIEEYVEGLDLRVIVIDYKVVAAAIRKPPEIVGTGTHTVKKLLEKYNRRRMAATAGESKVPFDDETKRCIASQGYNLNSVLPSGKKLPVRKTANLHTGGTIHDVTGNLNKELVKAAEKAATLLNIPVTGLDFCVPDMTKDHYVIIEANERPGLANHEPQPTAEKFVDLLFPHTIRK